MLIKTNPFDIRVTSVLYTGQITGPLRYFDFFLTDRFDEYFQGYCAHRAANMIKGHDMLHAVVDFNHVSYPHTHKFLATLIYAFKNDRFDVLDDYLHLFTKTDGLPMIRDAYLAKEECIWNLYQLPPNTFVHDGYWCLSKDFSYVDQIF